MENQFMQGEMGSLHIVLGLTSTCWVVRTDLYRAIRPDQLRSCDWEQRALSIDSAQKLCYLGRRTWVSADQFILIPGNYVLKFSLPKILWWFFFNNWQCFIIFKVFFCLFPYLHLHIFSETISTINFILPFSTYSLSFSLAMDPIFLQSTVIHTFQKKF